MGLFRSHPAPGRLFLTRADGRSLRRELAPGALENFAERVLDAGGEEMRGTWRRAGQAGSDAVLACWPAAIPLPERAMLGAGDRKTGPWLEARFARGLPLEEIAVDFTRWLAGAPMPEQIEPEEAEVVRTEVIPETPEPPAVRAETPCVAQTVVREPSIAAAVPPIVKVPRAAPQPVEAELAVEYPRSAEPVPPPAEARPEVLAPGARIAPPRAQVMREQSDDVFGLWGDAHPADLEGDSPELRGEDLPWLCPGDRLYSPRRGVCRLLALENERGRWKLRDERGREIEVASAELTSEFSFDDETLNEG